MFDIEILFYYIIVNYSYFVEYKYKRHRKSKKYSWTNLNSLSRKFNLYIK